MDFGLNEEQRMIVDTTRAFVEAELYPHEQMVERTGVLPVELIREIQAKAIAGGALCGQHAGGGRRRWARYPVLAAL
jgi:alkylation response protein AidB-like acyl-CoA dehydrogenase